MKKTIFAGLLVILMLFTTTPAVVASTTTDPFAPTPIEDIFLRGTVESILASDTRTEFGQTLIRQLLILRVPEIDASIEVPYETSQAYVGRLLEIGDTVIIGKSTIAGEESYYISDVYRLQSIIWIALFFLVITIVLIGRRGWYAIAGLVMSYLIIVFYLIPQVLGGAPPLMTAFIAALFISSVSLFVAHGLYLRTTVAFLSTIITIGIALVMSYVVVVSTRLSGLGTEEAFYLQYIGDAQIDIRGLLLGGILIGTLGVLDDITTAQAAAVEEIHKANHTLGFAELYRRGISVGKEHIISLVNTLVLAYTGAALPLILLFTVYPQPIWVTLNNEIVVEEIVRMLIGSIALVISVPFTTMLAAYFFSDKGARITKKFHWLPFFRSCEDSHACSHTHK